nr:hypothetical protein [uncultured Campylobacter sp.]
MKEYKFANGKILSYEDSGENFSQVLVYHHGMLAQMPKAVAKFCEENQIRLILVYRGGHFKSSLFKNDDTLLKFGLRMKEFLSGIGVVKFSVLGESTGAIYTLATAAACERMVQNLFLLSPFVALKELLPLFTNGAQLEQIYGFLRNASIDEAVMATKNMYANASPTMLRLVEPQIEGIGFDSWMQAHPLGFEIGKIEQNSIVWHSKEDKEAPFEAVLQISKMLPSCELTGSSDTCGGQKAILGFLEIIKEKI